MACQYDPATYAKFEERSTPRFSVAQESLAAALMQLNDVELSPLLDAVTRGEADDAPQERASARSPSSEKLPMTIHRRPNEKAPRPGPEGRVLPRRVRGRVYLPLGAPDPTVGALVPFSSPC